MSTRQSFMCLIKIAVCILLLVDVNRVCAQVDNTSPKVLWQKELSCGDGISCAPHETQINTVGNSLFIRGASFRPKTYTDGKFWLWEIDQNDGNEIRRTMLKEATKPGSSAIGMGAWVAKGFKVTNDGKVYTVGTFGDSTQSFLKTTREGINLSIKPVYDSSLEEGNTAIWRMIDLPDGNLLLIGRCTNSKAMVIKVDEEGNWLWKKTYEAGKISFFSDCVPVGNEGDFVIVGWSSETGGEQSLAELTDIRILKCNTNGEKMSEVTFLGGSPSGHKFPQICQLDSGNFVVAYDKGTTLMSTDYHIKVFSPVFKLLWEKPMAKSENNQPIYFHIKAVPGGNFIAAHCVSWRDIRVYKYDKDGNEIGKVSMDQINGFGDFSLEGTEDKVFIVSTTIPENREYITKVNVIALEL